MSETANGGSAHAEGDYSYAEGGAAGEPGGGVGGDGGHAHARGAFSIAVGGRGGRGGVCKGGPGGDAIELQDGGASYGGNGGESSQHDGRGGRGGTSMQGFFGDELARRARMKLPYGAENLFPGRGGDSLDTPQYMARRLIVEKIKRRFFLENGWPTEFSDPVHETPMWSELFSQILTLKYSSVWYDRTIVPLARINGEIQREGHRWTVTVEDEEYVFADEKVSGL